MPTLTVDLNRKGVYTVEAPDSFSADRQFTVELENHGQPIHIHLNLDSELSTVASLTITNHYVENEATRTVNVRTAELESPVTGRLKIVAGHGATTVYVTVTVQPQTEEQTPVQVDESLTKPPQSDPEPALSGRVGTWLPTGDVDAAWLSTSNLDRAWLPAVGFALFSVAIATAIGVVVGSPVVLFGTGIVVGAAIVAAFLALR